MSRYKQDHCTVEKFRCFNKQETEKLRNELRESLLKKSQFYGDSALKAWFLIEFGLSTGLRVSEIKNVNIGQLQLDTSRPFVFVKSGKGNKSRVVEIDLQFVKTVKKFLGDKEKLGESLDPNQPLFYSKRSCGKYSVRGLQYMFKRSLKTAKIPSNLSIHSLRHTYALALYRATKFNIRYVQRQLGHASMQVTQVYLDGLLTELQEPLKRLY